MKKILIFAGTTEGRTLSETLAQSGIPHTVSVATEYGEMVMKEDPLAEVLCGRMDREAIAGLLAEKAFEVVVDATHPYAEVVTKNIKEAAAETGVSYLRLRREDSGDAKNGDIRYFDFHEACADALKEIGGNIMLTTGSKDLGTYCCREELRERIYARVLPGMESLEICMKNGISGKQIIALQGPFSVEMNEALIRQYQISCLVTKMSGKSGGYAEKILAAESCGIPVFVVGQAKPLADGESFGVVCERLEELCGISIRKECCFEITLAGIGMGSHGCMTEEVSEAVRNADILLGAERMIAPFSARSEKKPYYRADQIIPYLKEIQKTSAATETLHVAVLFSGDSGFYSGAKTLFHALQAEIQSGALKGQVRILPGISSVSYLAAAIGESYQDAEILSIHGRTVPNLMRKLASCPKAFLLLSGAADLRTLGESMTAFGLASCEITAGVQLSYPEQQILSMTPEMCREFHADGLITCLIKNPAAVPAAACHGIPDSEFIRDKVPMTKEEVREVSICKLHLRRDSVVYDIGSGTGSIAVEMAGLSDQMQVFAIERKAEAVSLIHKNKKKFGLENIAVIESEAPDGMDSLPVPTHAFIGGSGKRMDGILDMLYQKNPSMRVVINAVTLETMTEMQRVISEYPVRNEEIVQMQVNRSKKVGGYHMMQAENPVWICAFDFVPADEMPETAVLKTQEDA